MRVQHDTEALKQALAANATRLEAPAKEVVAASDRLTQATAAKAHVDITTANAHAGGAAARGHAMKALAYFGGAAVVILALGFTLRMILDGYRDYAAAKPTVTVVEAPAAPAPAAAPVWPAMPQSTGTTPEEEAVITTNFSIFRSKEIAVGDRKFSVEAGHHFDKSTDTQFKNAWCYVLVRAGETTLDFRLGAKTPSAAPIARIASAEEKQKARLSDANIRTLLNACPWLDGNPDLASQEVPPDVFLLSGEVNANTVNSMIAAVNAGARRIELNSPGGTLGDAMRGYYALRMSGVETVVTGQCASACTLLLAAGETRSVHPGARVGVHQWKTVGAETDESDAQDLSGDLVALFKNAGISEEFFIAGSQTPPEDMRWLTRDELRLWRVTTS